MIEVRRSHIKFQLLLGVKHFSNLIENAMTCLNVKLLSLEPCGFRMELSDSTVLPP